MPTRQMRITDALAGRYDVQYELGSGGMSDVYLATTVRDGTPVAVKVLKPHLSASLGADRFKHEIDVAAQLSHSNIVPLIDSGAADGLLFLVMPFIDGENLRQRLGRETQLSMEEALRVGSDLASALDYAHGRGFIHRDIKPENILFSSGRAMITDFGFARAMGTIAPGEGITATGVTVGTVGYMSPEQAAGAATLDGRSDTYGLACVIYEMLAGEPPFTGATPQIVHVRQRESRPPPLATIRPNITAAFDAAMQRALRPDPSQRFPTASAFLQALGAASGLGQDRATVEMIAPPPPTPPAPARRIATVMMLAAAAAAAVTVTIAVAISRSAEAPAQTAMPESLLVFAFRTAGNDAEDLGEAVPTRLAAALNGAAGMRIADPTPAWGTPGSPGANRVEPPSMSDALTRAEGAGASGFIIGSVTGTQGRLDVTAWMYDVRGEILATARAASEADSLDALVDRLRRDLTAGLAPAGTRP